MFPGENPESPGLCIPPLFLPQKEKPGEIERRVAKRKRKEKKGEVRNQRKEENKGKPWQKEGNKEKKLSGGSSNTV